MPTDDLLARRFRELAERAYASGRFYYSDFLGLSETDILKREEKEIAYAGLKTFGGAEGCERVVARFGDASYEEPFPIVCLRARPLSEKFAEALTHRDILGALMNLGIKRETVGDIRIENGTAYIFCLKTVASVITDGLTRSRHTSLSCEEINELPKDAVPHTESLKLNVASERADALIAAVFRLSREKASALFAAEKVCLDGRLTTSPGTSVKEDTVVSVRGLGRFIYRGYRSETRKGRLYAEIEIYK